eukprot:m.8147 g.8147  ORF g.8147 m.8147 type:complete len:72 (+) comp9073_c0_seq1:44-259(+)
MWTESLPAFGIIAGALAFSGFALGGLNKLFHHGEPRRYGLDDWSRTMMLRDEYITGKSQTQNADTEFSKDN